MCVISYVPEKNWDEMTRLKNVKIMPNFQNFDPLSKFWPIFQILTHFPNFVQFSKFWPISQILANFQNFVQFWPIFKFMTNLDQSWYSNFFWVWSQYRLKFYFTLERWTNRHHNTAKEPWELLRNSKNALQLKLCDFTTEVTGAFIGPDHGWVW